MVSDCLFKRNNTYYFRLNLPQDIAPYFSRKEIWKSLKTKNYQSAKTTISKLLYTTERLFLHLRSGMFTDTQMKQLVKDYSKEELVAEMGAAFLCGHVGIQNTLENSAAYISGWLKALKNDKTFLVHAATQAQRSTDYILNVTHTSEDWLVV